MPKLPSPRRTIVSPRRSARNSSGSVAETPSKSISPSRSNQSTPLVTERAKFPACRYSFPSASTRHPASTSVRTAPASRARATS